MRRSLALLSVLLCGLAAAPHAQPPSTPPAAVDPALFAELAWRNIGPHRASRTRALTGVVQEPHTFYIGVSNGGVWKTTDAGRAWAPIFDRESTGSTGAIAVAPSDPRVLYVGTGEAHQRPDLSVGNGVYASTDAGRTWTQLPQLRDTQQITAIVVHPRDPRHLFVAALGHPYGPNTERGVFRSRDGGQTFERVLFVNENTGAADVTMDPENPDVLYAALWQARQGPWENGDFRGAGSGLFKSTDGGTTWRPLTKGLPSWEQGRLGRIGVTVAPTLPSRLYAVVEAREGEGIYRSDDAGESWYRVNSDPRVVARPSDAADIQVHPTKPDVVFVPTIVAWKSVDGGKTFTAFRGAPGGDDYQELWINPQNPDVMAMSSDQGAIISLNGGASWSSWYNQPTAAFYHVSTDNAFPYRVCGGQQESGSACIASRGDDGQITFREWHPVGVEEYGYVAPDPLNPDIVYGGKVSRYDRRTGQVQQVGPKALRSADYRVVRTMPVLFSPVNPRKLYFASNVLWQTLDGGQQWAQLSPDLTRERWDVPANVGVYRGSPEAAPSRRGVIYTIAPSPLDEKTIWVGTDDGLVHVTRDGGARWTDVTPPALGPWWKVSLMDASHFDAQTAYAAVNTIRLDDLRPHLYRTRDGGKTWTEIVAGIPDGGIINVVREDPQQRGLLFAGSEQAVYVSFDDGDHWQSLRVNMPATSIRDLVVKDDDLIVGTHGRSFWILDDITPLRQIAAGALARGTHLFEPQAAWRWRFNTNTDTPLPPDEPAGQNPADGALIHYRLTSPARDVSLEVLDGAGAVVRRYTNHDTPVPPVPGRNTPDYWLRPPQALAASAGLHRHVWDLRHEAPAVASFSYPIAAIFQATPQVPRGTVVPPGRYTVRLTVDGAVQTAPLIVRMDPRVKTTPAGLTQQYATSRAIDAALRRVATALTDVRSAVAAGGDAATRARAAETALARAQGQATQLLGLIDAADLPPTPQMLAAWKETSAAIDAALTGWTAGK
ncbi:MAG: glycoside hydrolase [Acidobacteria bacterium]|nr:glycoside hydrolase [Acidobacteriota bacterium]